MKFKSSGRRRKGGIMPFLAQVRRPLDEESDASCTGERGGLDCSVGGGEGGSLDE